jgi:hypothetical protein
MSAEPLVLLSFDFEVTYCCHKDCLMTIVLPATLMRQLRNDHRWFYCPMGHKQHFSGPSEAETLKRKLESEQREAEWWKRKAKQNERSAHAYKGQVTKIRSRVKNGVCPCCNRTFQNLMAHMQTKHPDYGTDKHPKKDE